MNRHSPDARDPGDQGRAPWRVVVRSFYVAIILVVAAVLWLGRTEFSQEVKRYYIFYRYPVTGLSKGADVHYNGIPVGRVVDVRIDPDNIELAQLTIEVDLSIVRIKSDAHAFLTNIPSGVSYIQIIGGTREAEELQPKPGHRYAEIAGSFDCSRCRLSASTRRLTPGWPSCGGGIRPLSSAVLARSCCS